MDNSRPPTISEEANGWRSKCYWQRQGLLVVESVSDKLLEDEWWFVVETGKIAAVTGTDGKAPEDVCLYLTYLLSLIFAFRSCSHCRFR